MNRLKFGAAALAGAFLFTTTASALQTTEIRRGVTMERQQELDDKRALRERIRSAQEEYRALRKANDPRAEQAGHEVDRLKAEWKRLHGNDTEMRKRGKGKKLGHDKRMKHKRQKPSR